LAKKWYEVLSVVNLVRKTLETKDMFTDVAIEKSECFFFWWYRENGFLEAFEIVKRIAREKLKERNNLMRTHMTQMVPHRL
jgi:hypothetical protein